jgi:hypothetical protein
MAPLKEYKGFVALYFLIILAVFGAYCIGLVIIKS